MKKVSLDNYARDSAYDRYLNISVDNENGRNMLGAGILYFIDPSVYSLAGHQCDNKASQIMSAGGKGYYVDFTPELSFENVRDTWGIEEMRMGQ